MSDLPFMPSLSAMRRSCDVTKQYAGGAVGRGARKRSNAFGERLKQIEAEYVAEQRAILLAGAKIPGTAAAYTAYDAAADAAKAEFASAKRELELERNRRYQNEYSAWKKRFNLSSPYAKALSQVSPEQQAALKREQEDKHGLVMDQLQVDFITGARAAEEKYARSLNRAESELVAVLEAAGIDCSQPKSSVAPLNFTTAPIRKAVLQASGPSAARDQALCAWRLGQALRCEHEPIGESDTQRELARQARVEARRELKIEERYAAARRG